MGGFLVILLYLVAAAAALHSARREAPRPAFYEPALYLAARRDCSARQLARGHARARRRAVAWARGQRFADGSCGRRGRPARDVCAALPGNRRYLPRARGAPRCRYRKPSTAAGDRSLGMAARSACRARDGISGHVCNRCRPGRDARVAGRRVWHGRTSGWLATLPPVESLERALFSVIAIGMAALTVAILAGLLFVTDLFAQHLVHKTVLALAAWAFSPACCSGAGASAGAGARLRDTRSPDSSCSRSPTSAASSCWRSCWAGTGVEALFLIAALALLALAGAPTSKRRCRRLRARRAAPASIERAWIARLRRRMAAEPRRTRLRRYSLRAAAPRRMLACHRLLAPHPGATSGRSSPQHRARGPAVLGGSGWLAGRARWRTIAAAASSWPLAPFFLVLPRRDPARAWRRAIPLKQSPTSPMRSSTGAGRAPAHGRVPARPRKAHGRGRHGAAQRNRRHRHHGRTGTRSAEQMRNTPHTRMPLFDGDLDRV